MDYIIVSFKVNTDVGNRVLRIFSHFGVAIEIVMRS